MEIHLTKQELHKMKIFQMKIFLLLLVVGKIPEYLIVSDQGNVVE
ncbi:hypothetical protein [Okeania sp. SIO3I5]|nr:hypothetical protein [Okeania sp. SIO3I5]